MFTSPYRCFEAGDTVALGDGRWSLASPSGGPGATLDDDDLQLARLFDGSRPADAVLEQARQSLQLELGRDALEGFAAALAEAGLLRPGLRDPLPVPATSDAEVRELGWDGRPRTMPDTPDDAALPPSSIPGSRNNPGYAGGLLGQLPDRRHVDHQLDLVLPWGRALAGLGAALIWPLKSRVALLGLLAAVAIALWAAGTHHPDWSADLRGNWGRWTMALRITLSAYLVNLFASAARAAAIARYTPERPRVGLVLGFGPLRIPRLFVETVGAAERAERDTRLRIVGAGLVGVAALFVLCVLVWFLTYNTLPPVAGQAAVVASTAFGLLLFRLNPLAQFDGYFLLCNWLGHLDLRAQALAAVFGYNRPWQIQGRALGRKAMVIYIAAVWVFWTALFALVLSLLGAWLIERLRGPGFLILMAVLGVLMQKQYIRSGGARSTLGRPKTRFSISKRMKIALGVAVLVGCIPYPYTPSGDFEVLPRQRADVRALSPGDVREVLVKEGDTVQAGQAIARLDDSAARAKVAESEAERARLQADLALVRKGAKAEEIEVARQRVATAQSASKLASQQAARIEAAYRGKSVTPQEYERARGAADVARQQLIEAQRALDLVASPAQDERITALEADVKRVEAELAYRQQELAWSTITTPIAGRVVSSRLQFATGNFLNRGELLAVVEDSGELLAEIRMPESVMKGIAVDATAKARFWAYPGSSFRGQIRSIAPAAEDARYGRVVRVQMVLSDPNQQLRSGMTGNAKVAAGWYPVALVFTRALQRFVMVEVWSWLP